MATEAAVPAPDQVAYATLRLIERSAIWFGFGSGSRSGLGWEWGWGPGSGVKVEMGMGMGGWGECPRRPTEHARHVRSVCIAEGDN